MKTGDDQIKLIDLVYWKKSHNIAGASMILYVSEITAKRCMQISFGVSASALALKMLSPIPKGKA